MSDDSDDLGFGFRSSDVGRQLLFYWALQLSLSINAKDMCRKIEDCCSRQEEDPTGTPLSSNFTKSYLEHVSVLHSKERRIDLAKKIVRGSAYTSQPRLGLEMTKWTWYPLSKRGPPPCPTLSCHTKRLLTLFSAIAMTELVQHARSDAM